MDEYGSRETSIKIEWGELGLKSSRWHQDLLWQKRIFDSPSTTVDEPNTSVGSSTMSLNVAGLPKSSTNFCNGKIMENPEEH